jgi:hypothetical protein
VEKISHYCPFKGTVPQDFLPPIFFITKSPLINHQNFFEFVFKFAELFEFDFPLHNAAGSQILPLHYAAWSHGSPLHDAAGNHVSPLHDAAGNQSMIFC